MKQLIVLILAITLVVVFSQARAGSDDPVKDDVKKLQGMWVISKYVFDGKEIDAQGFSTDVTIFVGNKLTVNQRTGTFTIDASKKPKTLDWTVEKGPADRWIYQFDGDMLKVAFGKRGEKHPSDFEGKGNVSMILKRKPK